jgi:hypothetical protein
MTRRTSLSAFAHRYRQSLAKALTALDSVGLPTLALFGRLGRQLVSGHGYLRTICLRPLLRFFGLFIAVPLAGSNTRVAPTRRNVYWIGVFLTANRRFDVFLRH